MKSNWRSHRNGKQPPLTIEQQMRLIRRLYAIPLIEGGLVLINLLGFFIGTIYWYGPQMAVISPLLWPWLVDSPLSVLGFGLALPLIRRKQSAWREWLATWAVFSNIKYGLWTVVFWLLWWHNAGTFTLESITMTLTHGAMMIMGATLLLFYRPKVWQVLTVTAWFALNDYLDYWGGIAPTVPAGVWLETLKVEQMIVTTLLMLGLLALSVGKGGKGEGGKAGKKSQEEVIGLPPA